MSLALIDYGAGNLRSVANALRYLDCSFDLCDSGPTLKGATRIILPGVGHFGAAMQELNRRGLVGPLVERVRAGVPLLGICLGLQLLFESSEEAPGVPGLGLLAGGVRRMQTKVVPHMGWNRLVFQRAHAITRGLPDTVHCYFANSFAAAPADAGVTVAEVQQDEDVFPAVVADGSLAATQFHPEKSGPVGLIMLRNFVQC
jgi:imidazole glycerol phosphate synthase glutamine amidotransferase subunit